MFLNSSTTIARSANETSCPAGTNILCWPRTPGNTSIIVSCAPLEHVGVDPTSSFLLFFVENGIRWTIRCLESITLICSPTGKWLDLTPAGCFYPDVLALMNQSFNGKTEQEKAVRRDSFVVNSIVWRAFFSFARLDLSNHRPSDPLHWISGTLDLTDQCTPFPLYILLLQVSWTSGHHPRRRRRRLVVLRSLYCSRTKIHINLLLAILIQIIARLTTYGFDRRSHVDRLDLFVFV